MQTALQKNPQADKVVKLLEDQKTQIGRALGASVPPDYFVRVALTALRKNPALFACTQQSLMQCFMDLAQVRLVPDSVTGEAYLIPYGNEATLIIGYNGYLKMVRRSNNVTNVYASVVYENDEFEIEFGSTRKMKHKPTLKGERGAWLGAVAFIAYSNKDVMGEEFVWVPADYIERVKRQARGSTGAKSPWVLWPESMWQKTALRQLLKTADLSPDVREEVSRAANMEGIIDIKAEDIPEPPTQPQPSELTGKQPAPQADPVQQEAPPPAKKKASKKKAVQQPPPQQPQPTQPQEPEDDVPMGDGEPRVGQPTIDDPELFQ